MATEPNPPAHPSDKWFAYYRFNPNRDSPNEARNTLLVVAALIAAACFQAGINPPGGVSQAHMTVNNVEIPEGKAILGSHKSAYATFLFFNALALSSSLQIITYLVVGCPFHFEVSTAALCMSLTYGFSIVIGEPPSVVNFRFIAVFAFLLPYSGRLLQQKLEKC